MKRVTVLLLCAAAIGITGLFLSCGNQQGQFTGSVILKDFEYNGTHTLHLALIDRGGSDSFIDISDSSSTLSSYSTTFTGSGPTDVTVADYLIEDPDFDVSEGLDLFLMIAEDQNDSGDLDAGDLVLPFFSLVLKNGETLELEGLEFDTGRIDNQPYSVDPTTERVWLTINDLLPYPVDSDNKVTLKIHDTINDFTNPGYYMDIVIEDRRLLGDMMLYSFGPNTYYFFLHYDTNNNGTIDSGDHVSYDNPAAVDAAYSADLGSDSGNITLELNSYTIAP